jgi:hypothetical protein
MMMNQRNRRIRWPEIRNRVIANDVLLQQVERMEPKPAAIENKPSSEIASSLKSE